MSEKDCPKCKGTGEVPNNFGKVGHRTVKESFSRENYDGEGTSETPDTLICPRCGGSGKV